MGIGRIITVITISGVMARGLIYNNCLVDNYFLKHRALI